MQAMLRPYLVFKEGQMVGYNLLLIDFQKSGKAASQGPNFRRRLTRRILRVIEAGC